MADKHYEIIETFENQYPGREYEIDISCPEFTCVCPKTGQPDFATIHVRYVPDKVCLESKSVKMYFFAFRSHGSFMETITNKILDDFVQACQPKEMTVVGEFNARGGLVINVCAEYKRPA